MEVIANSVVNKFQSNKTSNNKAVSSLKLPKLKKDTVSFNGHFQMEKVRKSGIKWLVHETGFFRDIQTKEFVKNYVLENFANKDSVKIIVGACSTGEEAYTYQMLLQKLKNKLKITGFDLSEKSVKAAKKGKFLMQRVRNCPEFVQDLLYKTTKDAYLCFDDMPPKTQKEIEYKKAFDEFFEVMSETSKEKKPSLMKRFQAWTLKKLFNFTPFRFESKYVAIRPQEAERLASSVDFTQGDILKLDEINKGEKADVITFSNAIYHLICDDIGDGALRVLKKNAEEIATNIAKQIKEKLNPKGILVFGEDEFAQICDDELVPKVFKKLGFNPLNETKDHPANVWQLN